MLSSSENTHFTIKTLFYYKEKLHLNFVRNIYSIISLGRNMYKACIISCIDQLIERNLTIYISPRTCDVGFVTSLFIEIF